MPKAKKSEQPGAEPKGSQETSTMSLENEVFSHYQEANTELETRITDRERGFDVYDRLYRGYITSAKWPYNARVTDGRAASLLNRKDDRLLANKMTGRMARGSGGTELGAKVQTELIHHDWNQVDVCTDEPMLMRIKKTSGAARRYGAGFAFFPWRKTSRFEGNSYEHLENRDVLTQPGARSIDECEWVQVRRYPTLGSLHRLNKMAVAGEIYDSKALAELKEADSPSNNYVSINKSVIGLENDAKRIEVVTEYRRDRWITFVPKQGKRRKTVVLSDRPNPYKHGEIPIGRLNYYPIDDDMYGVPELENIASLIKASWAKLSQMTELDQMELYTTIHANPREVQLDTLKFEKGAVWLMERPGSSVQTPSPNMTSVARFKESFGVLSSLIMEGVGETSQDISNQGGAFQDKTATEVRDAATLRTARDNANKIALRQFLARMVYFWSCNNRQFREKNKQIDIVGKEALQYFINEELDGYELNMQGAKLVSDYALEKNVPYDEAYEMLRASGTLEQFSRPMFPINLGEGQSAPKLEIGEDGKSGKIYVDDDDMKDTYNYIPDVEAMSLNDDALDTNAKIMFFDRAQKVEGQLAQQGTKIKWQDLLESLAASAKLKDAERYFEKKTPEEIAQEQQAAAMEEMQDQGGGAVLPEGAPMGQPPMQQPAM